MTLALQSPDSVSDLIAVDNAPVDSILSGDFAGYVRAMKKIDLAGVTRQAEADKILSSAEEVCPVLPAYHSPANMSSPWGSASSS